MSSDLTIVRGPGRAAGVPHSLAETAQVQLLIARAALLTLAQGPNRKDLTGPEAVDAIRQGMDIARDALLKMDAASLKPQGFGT